MLLILYINIPFIPSFVSLFSNILQPWYNLGTIHSFPDCSASMVLICFGVSKRKENKKKEYDDEMESLQYTV